jgi:hypothetical protein
MASYVLSRWRLTAFSAWVLFLSVGACFFVLRSVLHFDLCGRAVLDRRGRAVFDRRGRAVFDRQSVLFLTGGGVLFLLSKVCCI